MIINYLPKYYSNQALSNQKALMGFNIQGSTFYLNKYSNAFGSAVNPFEVFSQNGNNAKLGQYVFDISASQTDTCLSWFNSKIIAKKQKNSNNRNIPCPCVRIQILTSRIFTLYSSDAQSLCYSLIDFGYDRNADKQICCYDRTYGSLITQDTKSGFIYSPNESLTSIIGNK